jgi:hypothetical protein
MMDKQRLKLPDRLIKRIWGASQLFQNTIPAALGLASFALVGVARLPLLVSIACGFIGIMMLALYGFTASPDRLLKLYTRRFLHQTHDPHIVALLTSSKDERLDDYLRRTYPDWYLPALAAGVRAHGVQQLLP